MSVKSFVLDYGLPGIAAIGVGIVTFMFSGGPEEFPSTPVEEQDSYENESSDEQESFDEVSGQRLVKGRDTSPPAWALEIVAQNKAMSEEIRLLKEAAQNQTEKEAAHFLQLQQLHQETPLCKGCTTSSNTSSSAMKDVGEGKESSSDEPPLVEKDWFLLHRVTAWNMAMQDLNAANTQTLAEKVAEALSSSSKSDASGASQRVGEIEVKPAGNEVDLSAACELLLMYINNVLKNPTVPRYRRISTTNNSYAKSLSTVPSHEGILTSLGFIRKPENNCFEYDWHSLPAIAVESTNNKPTASKKSVVQDRPSTAGEALALLQEAVQLLTALKTGRTALAALLQAKLNPPTPTLDSNIASNTPDTVSSSDADPPIATQSQAKADTDTVQAATVTSAAATRTITTAAEPPVPVDSLLLSVIEVSEAENLAGDEEAGQVDFMNILKRAQDSKKKAVEA